MLFIDGHNLMGRMPGLSLSREETSREELLRRVAAFKGSGGERVAVVFDGDRPGSAKEQVFGGLRVVYAPRGSTADDEILRLLGRCKARAATVVTSDLRLADRVRELGGGVEDCELFLRRMTRPRGAAQDEMDKPEMICDDVEEWLELFTQQSEGGPGCGHKI